MVLSETFVVSDSMVVSNVLVASEDKVSVDKVDAEALAVSEFFVVSEA